MANPVVADSQVATDSAGSIGDSLSITFGASVTAGQLLILALLSGFTDGANTITTPTGFSLLFGDATKYGLADKIALGSEGATFTGASFDRAGVFIGLKITGVNTTTPVNASQISAASLISPSVTTTVDGCLILSILFQLSSASITIPSGYTLVKSGSVTSAHDGPVSIAVASLNQTTHGATATATWTAAGTNLQVVTLAIAPPGAGTTAKLLNLRREVALAS